MNNKIELENKIIRDEKGRFMRNHSAWNKGKKHTDQQIKNLKMAWILRKENGLGSAWNKGMNMGPNPEHSKRMKGKEGFWKGKHFSETHKINLSQTKKRLFKEKILIPLKYWLGKKRTSKWIEMRKNLILPFKDTKIELKIQDLLTIFHIEYFTHKYISEITHAYQCDILIPKQEIKEIIIPQKTIIECDGCYWHGCRICNKKEFNKPQEDQIEEDKIRTKELIEKGYKVIRLWEHDIKKMELNDLKEKLI